MSASLHPGASLPKRSFIYPSNSGGVGSVDCRISGKEKEKITIIILSRFFFFFCAHKLSIPIYTPSSSKQGMNKIKPTN
jgi:hypothetical protein